MNESDIENVKNSLKVKLKDYSIFKKCVKYKSGAIMVATALYIAAIFALLANVFATYEIMQKNDLSVEYFLELFFDTQGGRSNAIFFLISIGAFILIGVATIIMIVGIVKKKISYQKIYDQFVSTPNISHKQLVLISGSFNKLSRKEEKIANLFYILFKDEEDAKKMIDLIKQGVFSGDKKYEGIISNTRVNKYSKLSRYLMNNFQFNNRIEKVVPVKYTANMLKFAPADFDLSKLDTRMPKGNNMLRCESGYYLLFIEAKGRYLLQLDKISQEL